MDNNIESLFTLFLDIPRLTESLELAHGNTILHCLAERDDTKTMIKLLDAMGISKRENMLSAKNFCDLTTLDLARSYEFRQLIDWSRAQEGFYYLPTPPSVLIMYTTTNREGANKEKEALMQTFPVFNVEVDVRENPNESEMLGAIRDMQRHRPNMSALIVIIMSHGSSGTVCAGDGKDVKIQDILLQMCSPSLEGKPKVDRYYKSNDVIASNLTENFDSPKIDFPEVYKTTCNFNVMGCLWYHLINSDI